MNENKLATDLKMQRQDNLNELTNQEKGLKKQVA